LFSVILSLIFVVSIASTSEKIAFIAMKASCTMKDQYALLDNAPWLMGLLDDLAVYYRPSVCC
jgi:hypothetical protein